MKLEIMTEEALRKLVLSRLQAQGLGNSVSLTKSQFLETSLSHASFFVEIVLTRANLVAEAKRTLHAIRDEIASQSVTLECIIRALWEVITDRVKRDSRPSPAGMPIKPATGILFNACLRSGQEIAEVKILVTADALDIAAARFGYPRSEPLQWSPATAVDERDLKDLVVRFLEEELAHGGESYWDPVKYPELELNGSGVSYLLGHSAALMELVQAVNDAFDPLALPTFLHALDLNSIRIKEFDRALSEISNFLGGAYTRGQVFAVSASALYVGLKPSEQELLRRYYLIKVDRLFAEHQEFRQKFPKVFV